ncbi:MAG: helix-turn-helix domain-containing protein [Lachnospiraceae bacterium]
MQIGEVIRINRKRKKLTQEEMAKRLGVTAPAVNKWENGNSQPDIALLVPISRLLDITTDQLLSFHNEPTIEEIDEIIYELDAVLQSKSYEESFQWAVDKINQYPNSEILIWEVTVILDSHRMMKEIHNTKEYDDIINSYYIRVLDSKEKEIRSKAADSLFHFHIRKEQYEKAEEYIAYCSKDNPDRKRKQAMIYGATNRIDEAYKIYEELLYSSYQMLYMILTDMHILAMKENKLNKARFFVEKEKELARIFEMGKYHEISCELELMTMEKDKEATLKIMEQIIESLHTVFDFNLNVRNSPIF